MASSKVYLSDLGVQSQFEGLGTLHILYNNFEGLLDKVSSYIEEILLSVWSAERHCHLILGELLHVASTSDVAPGGGRLLADCTGRGGLMTDVVPGSREIFMDDVGRGGLCDVALDVEILLAHCLLSPSREGLPLNL